jgi:catechol 2,3-dioxygenase-like lactoylglutathione lyase family enzyme
VTAARPPFSLLGIDHIVYLVDDLDRAVQWYAEVLGCQPGYSYPKIGMEQLWCGSALIVLAATSHAGGKRPSPAPGGPNVDHVCINLSPFDEDELRRHLASHGVQIEQEALHGGARGMGRSFYIRDPFGNLLELKGPPIYPDGR